MHAMPVLANHIMPSTIGSWAPTHPAPLPHFWMCPRTPPSPEPRRWKQVIEGRKGSQEGQEAQDGQERQEGHEGQEGQACQDGQDGKDEGQESQQGQEAQEGQEGQEGEGQEGKEGLTAKTAKTKTAKTDKKSDKKDRKAENDKHKKRSDGQGGGADLVLADFTPLSPQEMMVAQEEMMPLCGLCETRLMMHEDELSRLWTASATFELREIGFMMHEDELSRLWNASITCKRRGCDRVRMSSRGRVAYKFPKELQMMEPHWQQRYCCMVCICTLLGLGFTSTFAHHGRGCSGPPA